MQELTPRQIQVLNLVAEGLTAGEASQALGLGPHCAARHIEHARDRLGAKTVAQAVAIALSDGLIPPVRAPEGAGDG